MNSEKLTVEKIREGKVKELAVNETAYFKELEGSSNAYVGLLKQRSQMEFTVRKLIEIRTKIQKGEIPMPLTKVLIPNIWLQTVTDKKEALKWFDVEIEKLNNSIKSSTGQIQKRYDDYVESAVRNREFLNRKYVNLKAKDIVPERNVIKDEEILFEGTVKDLIANKGKQEEFKKAKEEAVKRNKAQRQRKSKDKK